MKTFNTATKILSTNNEGKFIGYASVFYVVDLYGDIIIPGAFEKTLKDKEVNEIKLLWQHNMEQPIGKINQIYEDDTGLYIEGEILQTIEKGKEVYELMKAGVINGLSIGFQIKNYYYENKVGKRVITELALHEVSVVTYPANKHAIITEYKSGEINLLISSIEKAINILTN